MDPDGTVDRDLVKLRNRSRHATRNSSYAKGMMETLAQDVVGTGPVLDIDTQTSVDREILTDWRRWTETCDFQGRTTLAGFLQAAVRGFVETGEALFLFQVDGSELKLIQIEPDRLASPWEKVNDPLVDMGVEKDASGKVVAYWINKNHPGAIDKIQGGLTIDDFERIDAAQVIHLYRQDRPGQSRGVPWLAPALDLFAMQHRYTDAVIKAAETAASISVTLESDIGLGTPVDADDLDNYEIEQDTMVTLPGGYRMSQIKAEQPATTFREFHKAIVGEMSRCLNMPANIASANSADHNFASGRLDHQIYYKFAGVIRHLIECGMLRRVFGQWFALRQVTRPGRAIVPDVVPVWYWPGPAVAIDPVKEAMADKINLENLTTTITEICARRGVLATDVLDMRAAEEQIKEENGLKSEPGDPPDPANLEDDDDEKNTESADAGSAAA